MELEMLNRQSESYKAYMEAMKAFTFVNEKDSRLLTDIKKSINRQELRLGF